MTGKISRIICVLIMTLVSFGCKDRYIERDLVAFSNSGGLEGEFYFLGGGYIGEKSIYKYLWRDETGGIRQDWHDARYTIIYENNKTAPYIKITQTWKDRIHQEVGHDGYVRELLGWAKVTIPENSVKYEYEVDISK